MNFKTQVTQAGMLHEASGDALLIVLGETSRPGDLGKPLGKALSAALRADDLALKAGRCLVLHQVDGVNAPRLVFVVAADATAKAFHAAVAVGLAALKNGGARSVAVASALAEPLTAAHAQALVMAASDCLYVYRRTKPSAPSASRLRAASLLCAADDARELAAQLKRSRAIADGVELARELANRPANHCTPSVLADEAHRLGKAHGLEVHVLNRKDAEKLGMGCFLAVTQGSVQAPRFIIVKYQGAAKSVAPLVLVGKGITFDTGGISIKPAAGMDEMKFDMGGAASVLGTLRAVAELKPKLNLIGIVAACENMPGGAAVKPGDVVTSLSGKTVEILNTDAEGRLVLCDALTYAERFEPAAVVDIATLTGACVVALGQHRSGMFSSDESLAAQLSAAGDRALDPCWRLPLDDEYDESLKSNFADIANIGAPGKAGAVVAAMFLKRFTAKYPWAHLDIAGTAWKSGAAKGATGRPVALLSEFVLSRAG